MFSVLAAQLAGAGAGVTGVSVYQEAARHFILRSIASPGCGGGTHSQDTGINELNLYSDLRVGAMFSIKVQGLINNIQPVSGSMIQFNVLAKILTDTKF